MILKAFKLVLPDTDKDLKEKIKSFCGSFSEVIENKISFSTSDPNFYPKSFLEFADINIPQAIFELGDQKIILEIKNSTGEEKQSPHEYSHLEIDNLLARVQELKIVEVDHLGFNLPYFKEGIHPEILSLREKLKNRSLYYTFPNGEPWDFVLPGSKEEIKNQQSIDYQKVRTPKIEIVSFEKSSTPLIQVELEVEEDYQNLITRFPEGIAVNEAKCVWVYIKNPYGIDICFVLNETRKGDWSSYFKNSRLTEMTN